VAGETKSSAGKAADNPSPRRAKSFALRVVLIAGALAIAAIGLWFLLGPGRNASDERFTGYVVSDNIYMASPVAGTLTGLSVRRGQRIKAGDPLFKVDLTVREAQTEQARATIAANQAQVDQQRAGLEKSRSDLAAAQAEADRYGAELHRLTAAQREKQGSVAQLDIDQARASYDGALRKRDAASSQLGSASAAITAARAQVRQSEAALTSAQRELADLSRSSPAAGRVEDVMFKLGETVSANTPIVSIVPDGEVKVRFYVPQNLVKAYQPGRKVAVGCDGCAVGMTATIEFVSNEPEYTPPVIYGVDARQKLVFLVEALPANPRALLPGQPMDVAPDAASLPRR